MPEDERLPGATYLSCPDLAPAEWLELLVRGEVEVRGRMPWSSNATFLAEVSLEGVVASAVYKPGAGERPLRDFPGGLYRREVATYALSEALGFGIVPETVLRKEGPYGEGSLQRFIDADFSEHYFTLLEEPAHDAALRRIAGFDLIANNADRKGGHLLVDRARHLWGIDNGLCFHCYPKLRTVMWDFAGDPLPAEVLAAARDLATALPEVLEGLLAADELAAISERAAALVREGRFPYPDPSRRTHPWPLV